MEYLKAEQHYIDQYDLFTVNDCLDIIRFYQKTYKEKSEHEDLKNVPADEVEKGFSMVLNWTLYATKGQRYKDKKARIQEWVDRDTKEQEKYDSTAEPVNIRCPKCNSIMISSSKTLINYIDNQPLRVLFFMDCTNCKNREGVYDNGEIRVREPELCEKCKGEIKTTTKRKGNVITWIKKCKKCGNTETEIDDFDKSDRERLEKEKKDKELLEKYRKEFCLDEKEGEECLLNVEAMEYTKFAHDDTIRENDNPAYTALSEIRKIEINDLEDLLSKSLEKENFIKISLDRPELGQHVTVSFTTQNTNRDRNKNTSVYDLEKLIKEAIKGTNWKLAPEGITDRLGFLTGKLIGYETEEDLLKLVGKVKQPQNPEFDAERKSKLEAHPYAQLTRLFAKMEARDNIRNRRLEKEPNGYLLNEPDENYPCHICGRSTEGNAWWDKWGLKCLDCQRNINEGIIPAEISKNDKMWLKDWDITSDYGVHPSSRPKLIRLKILKARELKLENGNVYYRVYLVDENKEFFNKYPKISR